MAKDEKRATRNEAGGRVNALSVLERAEKSKAACSRLLEVPEVQRAGVVLLYATMPDELDARPAIFALAEAGKRILLPRCIRETREVVCVEPEDVQHDFVSDAPGVPKPKGDRIVEIFEVDVVVSPGRAFDRVGNRVGRGAGYYDRFFIRPGFRAFRCGIAFDCQLFPVVPIEAHDIPMDAVVTESEFFRTRRSRLA